MTQHGQAAVLIAAKYIADSVRLNHYQDFSLEILE
jgi:hypothetical protein